MIPPLRNLIRETMSNFSDNASPVNSSAGNCIPNHHLQHHQCCNSRITKDGNHNDPISISISVFACDKTRPETTASSSSKTEIHDHHEICEHSQEAEWDSKAQTIQESQWYVCEKLFCLILAEIRMQYEL
jgi:hypothetical protein